jgi:hypothetical protein
MGFRRSAWPHLSAGGRTHRPGSARLQLGLLGQQLVRSAHSWPGAATTVFSAETGRLAAIHRAAAVMPAPTSPPWASACWVISAKYLSESVSQCSLGARARQRTRTLPAWPCE